MTDIDKYISNLENEFKNYESNVFDNADFDKKLLILYAYYHYFNADSSNIGDLEDSLCFDDSNIDRIGGVFIDYDSDKNDVDVIIPCYVSYDIDFPGIMKYFKEAETSVYKARKKENNYRKKIADIFSNDEYKFSSVKPLKIRLVTNYVPQTVSKKKMIINAVNALKAENEFVSFSIQFGTDIEYEVLEIENPKDNVTKAGIKIDNSNNIISHGNEKSLVVNISASSLKELYELYGYRGLFAQNLRYYVKNTKVDNNIIDTIENKPENFWYYNNGIIIVCDDYEINGDQIVLTNFSIVNGGQTTKLIGEATINNDFFIICKIVKNIYDSEEDRLDFVANVAEASNTQKPIKGKDLIANKVEQRQLKKQLSEAGVYCQIKRGEKINKKIYPEAWQNTTNEEIGQFLLSFVYQKPGTARSNKASICDNAERYELLFNKKYNSEFIISLLKIKAYYKKWMQYCKKNNDDTDEYRMGLVNNGMLYMTAIIGAVCKMYYHQDYIKALNESATSEQKMQIVSQHDISHRVFNDAFDQSKAYELFEYCYKKFYRPGYEFLKSFKEKYNNYSNFTKVNSNYSMYVFRQISYEFKNGIPEEDKEVLRNILYEATDNDIKENSLLLEKYVNVISVNIDRTPIDSEETIKRIYDSLINYRTKTYKINHIKAFEVFKNVSADVISKYAPTDIEMLKELHCLDEAQIELYGSDIVDIVNIELNK